MVEGYLDCDLCGSVTTEEDAQDEMCPACHAIEQDEGLVEVPQEVLRKLVGMAKSRHPSSCHEDAPNFERVLKEQGYLPKKDGE